jgi:hypothetical protein
MNIKTIAKSIFVILLYYIFYEIMIKVMSLIGLNISDFSSLQKIITFTIFDILLIISLYFIYKKDLKKEFLLFKNNFKEFVEKYTKYWLLGIVLMSIINSIIMFITPSDVANNEELVRGLIDKFPLYGFFSAALVAPFVEEIVFRKTFKDIIKNKYLLLIICGLTFGTIHVIESYTKITDLLYIFSYGVFGSVFAYIYYKTNTVFTSMFFHFIHNIMLVLIYFVSNII